MIRQLRPTHIITQTQCKVCAVSLEDVERAVRVEIGIDAQVVTLEPYSLSDVWQDIRRIAAAVGQPERGEQLLASLEQRMDSIRRRAPIRAPRPRVAAIEWLEPLMAGGNWVPELIEMAGGENLFGAPGMHSHG